MGSIVVFSKTPITVASKATGWSHTGDTNETLLASERIPGGLLGAGDALEIICAWSWTVNGNNKTVTIRFGAANDLTGTAFQTVTQSGGASQQNYQLIVNKTTSSQVGSLRGSASLDGSTSVKVVSSVDTTQDSYLVFSCAVANSSDTATLIKYIVRKIPTV